MSRDVTPLIQPDDRVAILTSEFATGETAHGEPWIICRTCGGKSYNACDAYRRYCEACHMFHEDSTGYARRAYAEDVP